MKVKKIAEVLSKMAQENPKSDVKLHGLYGESALFICKKKVMKLYGYNQNPMLI